MSHFLERIKALLSNAVSPRELDEQYLSQASDVYDVERRQHALDHRARQSLQ